MNFIKIFCFSVFLLAVSACATGLWLKEGAQAFPPLESGKGRVFIYRTSTFGSAYTPDVLLNGEKVGKPDRPSMFFRDVLPGSYAVTTTLTSKIVNFYMGAGEKKYVKLNNSFFGSQMYPELVDSAKGEAEASGLGLMGQGRK